MKKNKHISRINLVLFLCSFFLFTVNSLSASVKGDPVSSATTVSAKHTDLPESSPLLSENEKENDFEVFAFLVPFFFLSIIPEVFRRAILSRNNSIERNLRPIYISVRNIRI